MKNLLMMIAITLISGCALSPQQVTLQPEISTTGRIQGAPVLQIRIEDQRPSDIVGTRGGLYGDTSFIRIANDLKSSLANEAGKAFRTMGARTQGASPQPITITLYLEELSYTPKTQGVVHEIALGSQVRIMAERQGRQHEGRFQSRKVHRFFSPPSEAENQRIINEILGDTLTRLVNDAELIAFLQS